MLTTLECLKEENIESKGGVLYLGGDYLNGNRHFSFLVF